MSEILDIIISAIDEASNVFDAITGSAEKMESELNGINGSELDDVANSADGAEKEIDETDEAVNNLSNDLGIIDSSMLMQLGEQVGQIGDKAEGMAQEMNTAAISVGQLATQTGIAEPEMVSLVNTISNATFPNDEAMMYIKSLDQMGVAAENLGASATGLDRINDAFGLGAEKTNSLGQELGVLGVDMNNVSSAFNALAYANANTVGGMDNYYTFLRKYDAEFRELGYNVDQASIIISAATQKFGGGRAALTGLSSALKDANGDTRKLEQALGIEAGALDHASELTGQYSGQLEELASEEAEHKTIVDQLGASWEDLSLALSPVLSPLTSIIGLIGSVGSFGLQIGGLQKLVKMMKEFNMTQTVTNLLESEGAVARIASALGITTEAAAAEGATVAFWGLAIAEGSALWPILAIAAAIAVLIAVVYEVGKAFGWWTDVSSMLDAIWSGINRLWSAFINHPDVQAILGVIGEAFNAIAGAIGWAWNALLEFFGVSTSGDFDIVRALIDGIGAAWNAIRTPIMFVVDLVRSVIDIFNQFRTGQMDLPTFIIQIGTLLINAYMSVFQSVILLVIQFGSQMLSYAIRAGRNFLNGVANQIRQVPGRVFSLLMTVVARIRSAIQAWISAGVAKVRQLITDITSPFTGVARKIDTALSNVAKAITKPFSDAYNTVIGIVDNIKSKVQEGMDAIGQLNPFAAGGDMAAGGETINGYEGIASETIIVDNSPIEVDHNLNVSLDLQNVPSHISTQQLVSALTDRKVLRELTSNSDFQLLDSQAKERLNLKLSRSRGV